jgi:hypothetical protein
MGIVFFDEAYLPITLPLLDIFLARYGIDRIVVAFEPDKVANIVARTETRSGFAFMFVNPPNQVIRDAEIERAVFVAGQKIDVKHHTPGVWIPGSSLRDAPE